MSNIANQIHGFTIDYEYIYTKNQYLTSERSERVRDRVEHSKKKPISPRAYALFHIYTPNRRNVVIEKSNNQNEKPR